MRVISLLWPFAKAQGVEFVEPMGFAFLWPEIERAQDHWEGIMVLAATV